MLIPTYSYFFVREKNTYFHLLARPITNTWTLLQSRSSIVLRRRCGPECIPTNLCKACWKPSVILLNLRSGTQAQLFEVMFLLVARAAHLDNYIVVCGIAVGSCAGSSFYGPGIEYLELWQDEAWQQKGWLGMNDFQDVGDLFFLKLIQEEKLARHIKTDSHMIKVTNWCTNFMINIIHIASFHLIFSSIYAFSTSLRIMLTTASWTTSMSLGLSPLVALQARAMQVFYGGKGVKLLIITNDIITV